MNRALLYLIFSFLVALGLPAAGATLQGTVRDPSGALVAGAEITLSFTATQETRTTKSHAQGHFSINGLPPHGHNTTVQQPEFQNAPSASPMPRAPRHATHNNLSTL